MIYSCATILRQILMHEKYEIRKKFNIFENNIYKYKWNYFLLIILEYYKLEENKKKRFN